MSIIYTSRIYRPHSLPLFLHCFRFFLLCHSSLFSLSSLSPHSLLILDTLYTTRHRHPASPTASPCIRSLSTEQPRTSYILSLFSLSFLPDAPQLQQHVFAVVKTSCLFFLPLFAVRIDHPAFFVRAVHSFIASNNKAALPLHSAFTLFFTVPAYLLHPSSAFAPLQQKTTCLHAHYVIHLIVHSFIYHHHTVST